MTMSIRSIENPPREVPDAGLGFQRDPLEDN